MENQIGDRRHRPTALVTATSIALSMLVLGGCSHVPDAVNPVHWYKSTANWISGDDDTEAATPPQQLGNDQRPLRPSYLDNKALTESLVSDRANAQHAREEINRQGSPTRPLDPGLAVQNQAVVTKTPVAAGSPSSVAPVPPPVPVSSSAPVMAQPAAVSAPMAAAQPAAPRRAESVEEVYRRRLAEFNRPVAAAPRPASYGQAPATARASMAPPPPPTYASATAANSPYTASAAPQSPPTRVRGVRSLTRYHAPSRVSSFDVGAIAFGEGTSEMTPGQAQRLHDVVDLYRQRGGTIRVVGYSASGRLDVDPAANTEVNRQLAGQRADVVAAELVRLGVPARKLYAGPAIDLHAGGPADGAEIFIDY